MRAGVLVSAVAWLCSAAACIEPQPLALNLPDEIQWFFIAVEDSNEIIHTTELLRRDETTAVSGSEETTVHVYGYAGVPFPDAFEHAADRSIWVTDTTCAPLMPAAEWRATYEDGRLLPEPSTDEWRFGASWLEGVCPNPGVELAVDVRCDFLNPACPRSIETDECRLKLDLRGCGWAEASVGRLLPDGRPCFDFIDGTIQCATSEQPEPPYLLSCSAPGVECPMHIVDMTARQPPPLSLRRARLVPAHISPAVPALGETSHRRRLSQVEAGYLFDAVLLPSQIVVVGPAEALIESGDQSADCRNRTISTTESLLRFVDRETLEITRTATAPVCLTRIERDPVGNGFVGTFSGDGGARIYLGRFDDQGRAVESLELPLPQATPVQRYDLHALLSVGRQIAVASILLWENLESGESIVLMRAMIAVDLDRFEILWVNDEAVEFRQAIILSGLEPELLVYDQRRHDFYNYSMADGAALFESGGDFGSGVDVTSMRLMDAVSDRILVSTMGNEIGIHFFEALSFRSRVTVSSYFESDADPTELVAWPPDPEGFLLVALTSGTVQSSPSFDAPRALLSLYDVQARSFVPGALDVGHGAIKQFLSDDAGMYALLPWEGSIVELTVSE